MVGISIRIKKAYLISWSKYELIDLTKDNYERSNIGFTESDPDQSMIPDEILEMEREEILSKFIICRA